MDASRLRTSPPWTPRPLTPSPWNTPQVSPLETTHLDLLPDTPQIPSLYLSTVARPMQEPNDLIHEYYNVAPVPFRFERDGNIPRTVEMPLLRRSEKRPTHALAIMSSLAQPTGGSHTLAVPSEPTTPIHCPPSPSTPYSPFTPVQSEPYILPIDASLFCAKFGHDVARSLASGMSIKAAKPLVRRDRATGADLLTLPLVPLYVPHPPSIPHLLLYAQGLPLTPRRAHEPPNYSRPTIARPAAHPSPSTLATHLLPISVIEEFPAAPAMAETMACQCDDESLREHVVFNQGLWQNVLLLAPADASVVDLVRTAWNVTAEARRLRERRRAASALAHPPHSPRPERGLPAVSVQYVDAAPAGYRPRDTIHLLPVPPRKLGHRRSQRNLHA